MPEPKVNHTSMELASALKFLKMYYPELWVKVDEKDIVKLVTISHSLFKTHTSLLEPDASKNHTPVQ